MGNKQSQYNRIENSTKIYDDVKVNNVDLEDTKANKDDLEDELRYIMNSKQIKDNINNSKNSINKVEYDKLKYKILTKVEYILNDVENIKKQLKENANHNKKYIELLSSKECNLKGLKFDMIDKLFMEVALKLEKKTKELYGNTFHLDVEHTNKKNLVFTDEIFHLELCWETECKLNESNIVNLQMLNVSYINTVNSYKLNNIDDKQKKNDKEKIDNIDYIHDRL